MPDAIQDKLAAALDQIDRPAAFCVSGSKPAILPGLEVTNLGPIALPLSEQQAEELKHHCEQAPYGKGALTLVDTKVRRVWRMAPTHFRLTNPDWDDFLGDIVAEVQEQLGLENQKLKANLYDLLLYEKGSFFLPHRDGEKLARMVATLVLVLPSPHEGGELIVRHEGAEEVVLSSASNPFHLHFAAFYADCEHEIRPLRSGHRLCLVYNLTLTKGKKGIAAPTSSGPIAAIADILRAWVNEPTLHKIVMTLEHQYTQDGLVWDALKGTDRAQAAILREAARQANCHCCLALLTYHEAGSAEYDGGRSRRGYYDESDNPSDYEMGDIYEESLVADNLVDAANHPLAVSRMPVDKDELLDEDALTAIDPEEDFEGYTGNAGMTLDRWYRHAAILLWPEAHHFEVMCDCGIDAALGYLATRFDCWRKAGQDEEPTLRAECRTLANGIIERWPASGGYQGFGASPTAAALGATLAALGETAPLQAFLSKVVAVDGSVAPDKALCRALTSQPPRTFQQELVEVFKNTMERTALRNARFLELLAGDAVKHDASWPELCGSLADAAVAALKTLAAQQHYGWRVGELDRAEVLAALVRTFVLLEEEKQLAAWLEYCLTNLREYPLTEVHVKAMGKLQAWLLKHVKKPHAVLLKWIRSCREQLEALTATMPQEPTDFRRPANVPCNCAECVALKKFLNDPKASEREFAVREERRRHLATMIQQHKCDLKHRTVKRGSPYPLICTKTTASYQASLKKYHQDLEYLAEVRAIEASLPS